MNEISPIDSTKQLTEDPLRRRLEEVGQGLVSTIGAILGHLPGAPHRPNPLAKSLKVNRAVTSHLLKATSNGDPLEILHLVPGPEPLRKITGRLTEMDFPSELIEAANVAIGDFDRLIQDEAGTRPALDALIAPYLPGAREKLELASRYSVFRGISQLKGVQGDLWIGTAIITPAKTDSERLDLTWLNGASAIQRLRPGVDVRFSYRFPKMKTKPADSQDPEQLGDDVTSLQQFCVNPPAQLTARKIGDAVHYHLPDDILGAKEKVDMFVVDHHTAAVGRYAKPGAEDPKRSRTAFFVEIAIPVAKLVFDVILHKDVFPGSVPELFFYDTGYNGVANVNDEARDHERVQQVAPLESLQPGKWETEELPNYVPMLKHLATRHEWDLSDFRGHRLTLQYPVLGWQVSLAFEQPPE